MLASAGPPFLTDDPEPVDPGGWEIDIGGDGQRGDGGVQAQAPFVEADYGLPADLQLHAIVPLAYDRPRAGRAGWGYGNTELGVKWRLLREHDDAPQLGVFPLGELPAASARVGDRHLQAFLPLWAQKSWRGWTTYGGGGYWINPGAGNRGWWFTGWALERQVTDGLMLGGEVFHETASASGGRGETGFNLGGACDLSAHAHLLGSAGRQLQGAAQTTFYGALQLTF